MGLRAVVGALLPMISAPRILIVDEHHDGPRPVEGVLREKFRHSKVETCGCADAPAVLTRPQSFDVVIAQHDTGRILLPLIWQFREVDHHTPLVIVSDGQRRETALAAGANAHLPSREWLRIGELVERLLAEKSSDGIHRQCA
jgi:hypothetical protein